MASIVLHFVNFHFVNLKTSLYFNSAINTILNSMNITAAKDIIIIVKVDCFSLIVNKINLNKQWLIHCCLRVVIVIHSLPY